MIQRIPDTQHIPWEVAKAKIRKPSGIPKMPPTRLQIVTKKNILA